MTTAIRDKTTIPAQEAGETSGKASAPNRPENPHGKSLSMHDGIPDWYDCCSCEAEPYWEEAMKEQPGNEGGEGEKG